MDIGMLWFDNDTQTDLTKKIETAAEYYLTKYGIQPNICFVNPCMTPQKNQNGETSNQKKTTLKSGKIVVKISSSVLPNHLWIGINGSNA